MGALAHFEQADSSFGHGELDFFAVAKDGDGVCFGDEHEEVAVKVGDFFAVGLDGEVAVAEAYLFGLLVVDESVGDVAHGEDFLTPGVHDGGVEDKGGDEIDEHAAKHDEKSLPDFLGHEVVVVDFGCDVFGVFGLVDHSGDADVAAEWYPTDAVLCLVVFEVGEESGEPLVARGEQMEVGVEEHVELLDLDSVEFRKEEVSAFVEDDQ